MSSEDTKISRATATTSRDLWNCLPPEHQLLRLKRRELTVLVWPHSSIQPRSN